jgi:hypothetical protein
MTKNSCLVLVTLAMRLGVFGIALWILIHAFRGIAHVANPAHLEGADGPWLDWHHIETGDLFVCRGTSPGSRPVRQFSLSPWTHVGIAYKKPDSGEVFIYHSDPENGCLDHVTGIRNRSGAQLNSLREYSEQYMGEIYVRQMRGTRPKSEDLESVMQEASKCRFTSSLKPMMRSAAGRSSWMPLFKPMRDAETGEKQYFCSELLAFVLKRLGVVRADSDERTYHPRSFAPDDAPDATLEMEIADGHEGFWPYARPVYSSES